MLLLVVQTLHAALSLSMVAANHARTLFTAFLIVECTRPVLLVHVRNHFDCRENTKSRCCCSHTAKRNEVKTGGSWSLTSVRSLFRYMSYFSALAFPAVCGDNTRQVSCGTIYLEKYTRWRNQLYVRQTLKRRVTVIHPILRVGVKPSAFLRQVRNIACKESHYPRLRDRASMLGENKRFMKCFCGLFGSFHSLPHFSRWKKFGSGDPRTTSASLVRPSEYPRG